MNILTNRMKLLFAVALLVALLLEYQAFVFRASLIDLDAKVSALEKLTRLEESKTSISAIRKIATREDFSFAWIARDHDDPIPASITAWIECARMNRRRTKDEPWRGIVWVDTLEFSCRECWRQK